MANFLRQLVARPRLHHDEANLDLCYVTDHIIATSGPSAAWPKTAYRNPLPRLLEFLNEKHGKHWRIFEFRAEGTGYPEEAVDYRIEHFPWPDHHPPPFALVPNLVASMRNWRQKDEDNVIVVHCKAGKGRSGTASVSYLISEEGWELKQAMDTFTEKRMRQKWGAGISIPSQQRYLTYVDRWRQNGKIYVERKVLVHEVQIWGLRDGVEVAIEGFSDQGKKIVRKHAFSKDERKTSRGRGPQSLGFGGAVLEVIGKKSASRRGSSNSANKPTVDPPTPREENHPPYPNKQHTADVKPPKEPSTEDSLDEDSNTDKESVLGSDVVFVPKEKPIELETSDVCLDIQRKTVGKFTWSVPTSVAHVWFNTWFEGNGPEQCAMLQETAQSNVDGAVPLAETLATSKDMALLSTDFPAYVADIPAPLSDAPIHQQGTVAPPATTLGSAPAASTTAVKPSLAPGPILSPSSDRKPSPNSIPSPKLSPSPDPGPDTRSIATEGIFTIEWSAMDGLKGSSQKGLKAFDRVAIKWSAIVKDQQVVNEPKEGEPVKQGEAADWRGEHEVEERGKDQGVGNESGEEGTRTELEAMRTRTEGQKIGEEEDGGTKAELIL